MHPAVYQGVVFDTHFLKIAKPIPQKHTETLVILSVLVSRGAFFTPKQVNCFMCRLRCLKSGGKHAVLFDFSVVCQILLPILEMPLHSDASSGRLHSAFSEVISYC